MANKLYTPVILEHNKNPYHFQKVEGADLIVEAYNQICGDQFKLYLKLEEDRIREISFYGYGCAISKASTSVLAKTLEGRTLKEARAVITHFLAFVTGKETAPWHEDFQAFAAAKDFPSRMKCTTLSWDELEVVI